MRYDILGPINDERPDHVQVDNRQINVHHHYNQPPQHQQGNWDKVGGVVYGLWNLWLVMCLFMFVLFLMGRCGD